MFTSRLVLLALTLILAGNTVRAESLLEKINAEVTGLFETNKDAVVKVYSERKPVAAGFPLRTVQRAGSGFFIDAEGRILTTATIIEEGATCWVNFRGQRMPATILGRDAATNLALLKISTNTPTPFVKLGNSDTLRAGSLVVAVGFPFELPIAPVVGFVSGFDIQHGFHQFVTTHVRTDCRLSPGQAGGPFFDAQGSVVGIAVAARMDNQCYALPINAARQVVDDILQHGRTQLGWVGLAVADRPSDGRTNTTVVVQQIYSNSPAASIGFRDSDVVVRIGTNQVRRSCDVIDAMFHSRPGDRLTIVVLRESMEQQFTLVVGERPVTPATTAARLSQLPTLTPASDSR